MGTPPFYLGKVGAGAEAQSGELRAHGNTPALLFHVKYNLYNRYLLLTNPNRLII